jgi:hypothetical protein
VFDGKAAVVGGRGFWLGALVEARKARQGIAWIERIATGRAGAG